MWVIRILSGPMNGQIIPLKQGGNLIGRAPECDIVLEQSGISKKHCKIDVLANEIILSDQNSRNGTFVNGVKIRHHRIEENDKIAFNDLIVEIIEMAQDNLQFIGPSKHESAISNPQEHQPSPQAQPLAHSYHGNAALNPEYQTPPFSSPQAQASGQASASAKIEPGLQGFIQLAQKYIDEVVLPGVYKLAEYFEFKWVLMGFMALFIAVTTSLSVVPLMRILRSSIEAESQSHALTIARFIAKTNQPTLLKGTEAAVTVDFALNLRGVETAYIVNMEGRVLAPPFMAGNYAKHKFVHTARKEAKETVRQIDGATVGALVPITYYNPNTGSQSALAFSVVIYDMGSLAANDKRTLSLFVQTLFIALLVGAIIFFFMYRLIRYPIDSANIQLDKALREGSSHLNVEYKFEEFQNLIANISSTLSRLGSNGLEQNAQPIEQDRSHEMSNVVQLVGFPALTVQAADLSVSALNTAFEEKTGVNTQDVLYGKIDSISDQSLKLSFEDLIQRTEEQPEQLHTNEIEFGGIKHELVSQAVFGASGISYFLFVILPADEEEVS